MRKLFFGILLVFSMLLAACGGGESGTAAAEIDIDNLPATVSVDTVNALNGRDDVLIIDVREQWEYDEGHIPGITHIPMGEIPNRLNEIPNDVPVIFTCRSGNRSGQVTDFLAQSGFDNVHNMSGGILAWESAGYEVER